MAHEKIVVLDFGSQYAHLIAKRFRLMGFYSEIALPSSPLDALSGAKGIVFSGGPSSVYEENIPAFNPEILTLDVPILGLCYGHQLLAQESGGKVENAAVGEFGQQVVDRIVERRDLRETLASLLALHNAGHTETAGQGARR